MGIRFLAPHSKARRDYTANGSTGYPRDYRRGRHLYSPGFALEIRLQRQRILVAPSQPSASRRPQRDRLDVPDADELLDRTLRNALELAALVQVLEKIVQIAGEQHIGS
jgi:hypothetical protein